VFVTGVVGAASAFAGGAGGDFEGNAKKKLYKIT